VQQLSCRYDKYVYIQILFSVVFHINYDYTRVRTIDTLRFSSSRMVMLLLLGSTSLHFTSLHFTSLPISHSICAVRDMFVTTDSYDCTCCGFHPMHFAVNWGFQLPVATQSVCIVQNELCLSSLSSSYCLKMYLYMKSKLHSIN